MMAIAWSLPLGMAEYPSLTDRASAEQAEQKAAEAALVQAARDGDAPAYRVLVDRYRDRVLGLATRIVRDPGTAEEVAQDAFVRAWQALPAFRGDSRFSTWLYRIAYRRALDERAAGERRRTHEVASDTDSLERTAPLGPRPSDWALRLRLERFVRMLPEAQRACVTLFYADDQSVEEVARVLELPPGTVKTHLFRARKELLRMWKLEHPEGTFDATQ
jgi:RNA polymerase sigma-70 factor (ECF subfamily)